MNENTTLVLVSHKSKNLILKFIKEIYKKLNIIIIDNSNDLQLKKKIKESYPNITLKIVENNGYAAAINYASRLIKTKYFIISNPDVEGINEKVINEFEIYATLLKDKFSCLGPRFINTNPKSHIQSNQKSDIAPMKFISGACMFFEKKNFDSLGGFDENFFLYFEESDYCFRGYKKNKNYQINKIKVNHHVGSSVKIRNDDEKEELQNLYTWHFIWSKFYYYKKHYSFIVAITYFIPIIIRIKFRIIYYTIKKNKKNVQKYKNRWSGLINSIKGKKSFKRINEII
mgnify:CR=1 FL=1